MRIRSENKDQPRHQRLPSGERHDQRAVVVLALIDGAADHDIFSHESDQRHDYDRQRQRREIRHAPHVQRQYRVSSNRKERAMREIGDVENAEHQRQPDRDHGIAGSEHQAVRERLQK